MQTALGVTVPGRYPSTSELQGKEPGKPESQPGNYYGIRICHSPVMPWSLGAGKLQGCAISGGAKSWQAVREATAAQLCQAACIRNGNPEFSWSLDLGLDHWMDLTEDILSESVPGLGLWDSPGGFSLSRKPRVSVQPAYNPGTVFLDWSEVDSSCCKWNIRRPANWLLPLQQLSTYYYD